MHHRLSLSRLRARPSLTPLLAVIALAAGTGCAAPGEEEVAQAVVTSALATNENGGVGKEVVETMDDTCVDDPELAALDAANRPSVGFVPSTCVEKTADGNTLHAELDQCTGRFGRTVVDGGLDAVIDNIGECRLRAEIVDSGDLTANGKPLEYSATAYVRLLEDDMRDVDWEASWSGTTRRGKSIQQDSHLTILASGATSCVTVDGTADGRVEDVSYDIEIDGIAVCPDECPSAGVVQAHAEGRHREGTMTVSFDGSDTARVIGWSGDEFDVEMNCAPVSE